METIQTYMTPVQNALKNPSGLLNQSAKQAEGAAKQAESAARKTADEAAQNPESLLTRLRNFDTATLASVGVVAAETIGFFSVGEMLGRFKIVGYRSEAPAHH